MMMQCNYCTLFYKGKAIQEAKVSLATTKDKLHTETEKTTQLPGHKFSLGKEKNKTKKNPPKKNPKKKNHIIRHLEKGDKCFVSEIQFLIYRSSQTADYSSLANWKVIQLQPKSSSSAFLYKYIS